MVSENLRTVRALLENAAAVYGEKTFIRFNRGGEDCEKTFADVWADSLAVCRMLRSRFETGAHIALIGKTSYEYVAALCGGFAGGFVLVPVSPEVTAADALVLLRDADVQAVLYESEFEPRMEEIRAALPAIGSVELGGAADFGSVPETCGGVSPCAALSDVRIDPYAPAVLIYTSGTTGEQKGVMLSNFALMENVMYKAYFAGTEREDDVRLSVLPMHHVFCFVSDFLSSLKMGNTLCLNGQMRDLFANLLRYRPTAMRVVHVIAGAVRGRIRAVHA
jgi:long-chain acyl-CoA synthetase